MSSSSSFSLSRRSALGLMAASSVALATSTAFPSWAAAAATDEAGTPFSFEWLTEEARKIAAAAEPPVPPASAEVSGLTYDVYRLIQFRPENAHWEGDNTPFRLHAFHLGWLYQQPVELFDVVNGTATPIRFHAEDFNYFDPALGERFAGDKFPGVAGFRINYPLNRPDAFDELLTFLGASYFRALGRDNIYGISARGLVINSWGEGPEEFPRFSRFWFERGNDNKTLTIHALLESHSVAGAYRFVLNPGGGTVQETDMEVTCKLFFRAAVQQVGIAPLTSMFLFAENNRAGFDDYRPKVTDSDGLFLRRASGETMWRPLNNTDTLGNSYLAENNPRAFGLEQRDREFRNYQDAGAEYDRRPSLSVEPIGDWGKGLLRLIEIPSHREIDDNIVAFWVPDGDIKAGTELDFSYRLRWGDLPPDPKSPMAYVQATRGGLGGVSGSDKNETLRKFVVDFAGGELAGLDPSTQLDILATVSAGKLMTSTLFKVEQTDTWRLVLDVDTADASIVELRAYVVGLGRKLTETWLYQWRASA